MQASSSRQPPRRISPRLPRSPARPCSSTDCASIGARTRGARERGGGAGAGSVVSAASDGAPCDLSWIGIRDVGCEPPRDMPERYIETILRRVHLQRGGRAVLRGIDWTIRPGERWILAGANGAGKTQLLKLIAGSVWPTPCGREVRHYRWKGETWRTPHEIQDEIGYVGPERQDKYTRYGWNHTVEQIVTTGIHRTDIPLHAPGDADRRRVSSILRRLRIE